MAKIKTNRCWQLSTSVDVNTDTLEVRESHEGGGEQFIVIPGESIDKLVLELLKAKEKFSKN